jgi:Sulfotransferase family
LSAASTEGLDIKAENFVWIFGVGRSGSTWLASMMGELTGGQFWNEPLVGKLFGDLYYSGSGTLQADRDNFVYARKYRDAWLRSIRAFVLDAAAARFPEMSGEEHLVIKEPNGSVGAPLLMEALPESGIILLVRDPRDVVASTQAAREEGGWLDERHKAAPRPIHSLTRRNPEAAVKRQAKKYMQSMGNAKEAYDAHKGRKVMVHYEDLRADTLGTMRRIYSTLEIPVDENELARAVEKHAWENIPDEKKGEGKFNRKATPGSWREDLTPEQAEIVEEITAPLLRELYAN